VDPALGFTKNDAPIMTDSPCPRSSERQNFLHYRLTHEEWIQAVKTLKPAEKDVLYYLRTLDPFGDRYLEFGVREIARILDYDPGTISRALKSLDAKKHINLDLLRVGVRIRSRRLDNRHLEAIPEDQESASLSAARVDPIEEFQEELDPEGGCCSDATLLSPRNTHDPETTLMILRQHLLSVDNTWPLKPLQGKGSRTPHTNQTIHTLLNKRKRERSEKFSTGNTGTDQAEPPPQDTGLQQGTLPDPPVDLEFPGGAKSSAEADDEFFEWVLTQKIPRLPQKPASPRSAARGWIEKHEVQLYAEYLTWLAGPQRGPTAHTGPPPPPPIDEETPAERLRRYQQLWQTPICRNGIRRAIEENPDWNVEIGPDGPQEKTHADDQSPIPHQLAGDRTSD
jgi:hypothetical protein